MGMVSGGARYHLRLPIPEPGAYPYSKENTPLIEFICGLSLARRGL